MQGIAVARTGAGLLVVLVAAGTAAGQQAPDLRQAVTYFHNYELSAADSVFRAVAEGEAPPEDQVEARGFLALIAWRYRRDWAAAELEFQAALELGVDSSQIFSQLSRMARERGRHREAMAAARHAVRTASSAAEEAKAARMLGKAALASVENATWDEPVKAPDSTSAAWLDEAQHHLMSLLPSYRGFLDFSRVTLRVSLLAGDGPAALDAWRSYYATLVEKDDAGLLEIPRRMLESELLRWGTGSSGEDRMALTQAFAASGMFEEAWMAGWGLGSGGPVPPPQDPRTSDILAYAQFLPRLETATNEYYRRTSLGAFGEEGNLDTLRAQIEVQAQGLWPRLHWQGAPPDFSLAAFADEVQSRFGAYMTFARSAGRIALWYGHVVVDDSITVRQYGHTAPLRFVSVDGIVSIGFNSWANDYRSRTGGTANDERILQFRPSYADGPVDAWWRLTDPDARPELLEQERQETERDWERARRDPYGYLPGLAARLDRQGLEGLRDSLEAAGIPAEQIKPRFLAAHREAVFGSSIVAHEGRHAIDRRLGREDDPLEDKEFRAKLSEVAFAAHPRLALRSIVSPSIGNPTSHGQANARIMRGLVAWMEVHGQEIDGWDATLPLLPQLDRLSDKQLRAAVRSMDAMAKGEDGEAPGGESQGEVTD